MRVFGTLEEIHDAVGQRLGESGWRQVNQREVDAFAKLSGDHQWIHVDQERASAGPYGCTIVHGMLTLSLIIPMLDEIFRVERVDSVLNKGLDRLRFHAVVPVGSWLRTVADLTSATARPRGFTELVLGTTVEVRGLQRPACTAQCRLLMQAESGGHSRLDVPSAVGAS